MKQLFGLFLLLFIPQLTQAWVIENFDVVADIQTDGSVIITETISGNFSDNLKKHGIFRDIPYIYEEEESSRLYETPLELISITDEAGKSRPYKFTKKDAYKSYRIGDPNAYVQAQEVYKIKYKVTGVLKSFEAHDEFYWNVTGDQWDTGKQNVRVKVNLPLAATDLKTKCYTGISGSKAANCKHTVVDEKSAAFITTQPLRANEDLTIVFGFEKGLVEMPVREYKSQWLQKIINSPFLIFVISLLSVPFVIIRLLYKKWKLKKDWGPIIPIYEPPEGLSLGEIGKLYDGRSDSRDLTAVILSLCVKGYLSMEVVDKKWPFGDDYRFNNLKSADESLTDLERFVHDGIFVNAETSVLLSSFSAPRTIADRTTLLRPDLGYKTPIFSAAGFSSFGSRVQNLLDEKDFYKKGSPAFLIFGMLLFPVFIILLAIIPGAEVLIPLLVGVFVVAFSFMVETLSPTGNQKRYEIACYKEFLDTAEKDRLDWSAAQNIFETHLPYAVNLGVSDKWAALFDGHIKNPNWYVSPNSKFEIQSFTSSMNGLSSNVSRSFSPPKSSGSSGFSSSGGSSGGGSGGGGGGSW